MEHQPFEWTCKRDGCKRFLMAWTEKGLQIEIDRHMEQHQREDVEVGVRSTALTTYKRSNYETLSISMTDAGFLRTRLIKLDDDIVIDESPRYQASKTELARHRWAAILDAAWPEKIEGEEDDGIKPTE